MERKYRINLLNLRAHADVSKAAIYWCNDNAEAITLGSYSWIADGAYYIWHSCQSWDGERYTVAGQAWNEHLWNVYVTDDWC